MRWIPLEANPQVMDAFCHSLGLPEQWSFIDVWSLDDDLLETLPRPVRAMLMLFPVSDIYEERRLAQDKAMQNSSSNNDRVPQSLYFTRQTIGNACGTIGLIHSIANSGIELKPGALRDLLDKSKGQTPEQCAQLLEADKGLEAAHATSALEGQTQAPSADEKVDLHFTAFVEHNGNLFELDGRRPSPINHGPIEDFARGAARVIKQYMAEDPNALEFCVLALVPASS